MVSRDSHQPATTRSDRRTRSTRTAPATGASHASDERAIAEVDAGAAKDTSAFANARGNQAAAGAGTDNEEEIAMKHIPPAVQAALKRMCEPMPLSTEPGECAEHTAKLDAENMQTIKAYIEGMAAPAPSAWISVADRMPELDAPVLAFCPGNDNWEPRIDIEQWSQHCEDPVVIAWWDHDEDEITHWMDMPAFPSVDPFVGIAADFAAPEMITGRMPADERTS